MCYFRLFQYTLYSNGDSLLKIRQIKVYADGIIHNATAALSAPYVDNLGLPFNNGLNYFTETRLANYITQLETTGYDFHIHAIGDRGITESLNAIAAARTTNGNIGARHRVTHVEMVNPTDFPRFNALNVVADMQVAGNFTQPANWPENDRLIGPVRSDNWVPLKDIKNANAKITLDSLRKCFSQIKSYILRRKKPNFEFNAAHWAINLVNL